MFKTISELSVLVNSAVVVERARTDSSETVKTEGTLRAVGVTGIVFEAKGKAEIIDWALVVDIYAFTAPRKVVRRKVRYIPAHQARQHLLDRHGMPWDLIKFITDDTAYEIHNRIVHKNLGHQHRDPGEGGEE